MRRKMPSVSEWAGRRVLDQVDDFFGVGGDALADGFLNCCSAERPSWEAARWDLAEILGLRSPDALSRRIRRSCWSRWRGI